MIRYGFNLSRFCFLWSFPSLKRHSGLWTISSCLATTQLDLWDCLTHGWFSLRKQRSTKGSYKESMDFPRMYRSAGSWDGAPFLTPRFVCFFTFYFVLGYIQLRRRRWHPTPVLLPGKSHGWGSLVGWSPWGRWESDTTERLHFHFSLSCIGEGNGNPLQCSCLENPRDNGAWWAAVYGVAQSRTWLKRLSSSSSISN